MVKKYFILCFLFFASWSVEAQSCFARVSLDRRSVYVQQPFKVTITVLTATWYTQPLDFDNIQIPNAFVLPFDQTQPGMFDVRGKQYAGLTFYFIVFPYKEGSFVIPSLNIVATTPPEGSSESRKITIHTEAQHFTVKPIPEGMKQDSWFVAKDVSIHERWNKGLNNLKVGDIIERTVTIDARGTLPQFIPPLPKDSLSFASIYPQDQELEDRRNEHDANGRAVQKTTFLLEKEGTFTIPPVTVSWWNPLTRKPYKRSAPAAHITVHANNNLGILTTLRDSLSQEAKPQTADVAKSDSKKLIMGLPWYWFVLACAGAIVVLYILFHFVRYVFSTVKRKHEHYRMSEPYWFRKFMHATDSPKAFYEKLYAWWDRFPRSSKSASITQQLKEDKTASNWAHDLAAYNKKNFSESDSSSVPLSNLKNDVATYRKAYLKEDVSASQAVDERQQVWKVRF